MKHILLVIVISIATSVGSVWVAGQIMNPKTSMGEQEKGKTPANYASFKTNAALNGAAIDFSNAASAATPAVVHIKTKISSRVVQGRQRSPFADLFGEDFGDFFGGSEPRNYRIPEQRASGSGVLITEDGYIVTNNHVVDNASEIDVTLPNKKSFKATLVGADPSSDLAVLKIEGEKLPYILWGNSDEVKLGQWVLAIGYPWTLDVTVTAGIVSAKARTLDLNRRRSDTPIESFIQTDAAVNQGNSGGALVDTEGKLIGINSAIASQTGSYAGYSYAIPVNLARKISGDLIKYGTVQRAYIGVSYVPENAPEEQIKQRNVKFGDGVYVSGVSENGAAQAAGIKENDYITAINGVPTPTAPEMVEQVARYKPGDKVKVTIKRDGKEMVKDLTLRNQAGNFDVVTKESTSGNLLQALGASFEDVSPKMAESYGVDGGVRVKSIGDGALKNTRMQNDFIITSVNGKKINNMKELETELSNLSGTVRLEGVYPGFEGLYGYPLNLSAIK